MCSHYQAVKQREQFLRHAWRRAQRSFTLLTINADAHPLMRNFHKPGEEKRMLVILPPAARSEGFLRPYPADALVALVVRFIKSGTK